MVDAPAVRTGQAVRRLSLAERLVQRIPDDFFAQRKRSVTVRATDLHKGLLSDCFVDYNPKSDKSSANKAFPACKRDVGYNQRMSIYYTRTGDDGETGLLGEGRVPKHHPVPETVGDLDEATANLGVARAICRAEPTGSLLLAVQRDLYHLMAEVSATPENVQRFRRIDAERVAWLEAQIEAIGEQVQMPNEFIVPGDSPAGAALAVARTVVRRAERRLSRLQAESLVQNHELLRYLNRLASLCFVLELLENQHAGRSAPTLAKAA